VTTISVNLYQGFGSDRRLSMDIYASATQSALLTTEFSVEKIQARSVLEQYSANRLLMRYLRYYQFPQSIVNRFADIHHVLDHGYAHLFLF